MFRRRRRRRKRRATRGGRVMRPSPKSNGEWKRPCSARKRAPTSDVSDIAFTGRTAEKSVRHRRVGPDASSAADLKRLVKQEVSDTLAEVAVVENRPGVF